MEGNHEQLSSMQPAHLGCEGRTGHAGGSQESCLTVSPSHLQFSSAVGKQEAGHRAGVGVQSLVTETGGRERLLRLFSIRAGAKWGFMWKTQALLMA